MPIPDRDVKDFVYGLDRDDIRRLWVLLHDGAPPGQPVPLMTQTVDALTRAIAAFHCVPNCVEEDAPEELESWVCPSCGGTSFHPSTNVPANVCDGCGSVWRRRTEFERGGVR
jgi:hypothetical protein